MSLLPSRTGSHHTLASKLKLSIANSSSKTLIGSISFPKDTNTCKLSWREPVEGKPAQARHKSISFGPRSKGKTKESALTDIEFFQLLNTERIIALRL